MTYEFKDIIEAHLSAKEDGLRSVLATVVDLDGSSYRKPGVRMLILENDEMIGAVSGGCVEKDILRQSKSVFTNGKSKMMTYDGRFRLGCEGILYILLEELILEDHFISEFNKCIEQRDNFNLVSSYVREVGESLSIGSYVRIDDISYSLSKINVDALPKSNLVFNQNMPPCFKLVIFGGEHDTVQLCKMAALIGWEVTVIIGPSSHKTISNFPEATHFISATPENVDIDLIDDQTAIMIMTHNFVNDLKSLMALKDTSPAYLGLLGPVHKRENLIHQLLEYVPDVTEAFIEKIYGPAGLDIGSETPQEIVLSILSEILAVSRNRNAISLKEKTGKIHI